MSDKNKTIKGFSCDSSLWEKAKRSAKPIPLSVVIRQLIKMWLAGAVQIDWSIDEDEGEE